MFTIRVATVPFISLAASTSSSRVTLCLAPKYWRFFDFVLNCKCLANIKIIIYAFATKYGRSAPPGENFKSIAPRSLRDMSESSRGSPIEKRVYVTPPTTLLALVLARLLPAMAAKRENEGEIWGIYRCLAKNIAQNDVWKVVERGVHIIVCSCHVSY